VFRGLREPPVELASELKELRDAPIGLNGSVSAVSDVYGKWKSQPKELIERLESIGREGLQRFGYL